MIDPRDPLPSAIVPKLTDWPPGFLDESLSAADQAVLQEAGHEMEDAIYRSRRDRQGAPPL